MPDPNVPGRDPNVTRTVQKRPVRKGNDLGTNLGIFALTFLLSLGGGYLLFNQPGKAAPTSAVTSNAPAMDHSEHTADTAASMTTETTTPDPAVPDATATTAPAADGEIFTKRGCVACHSISALSVNGGVTGPDLSKSFLNVPDKHGVPIEDFLKKPTSAVMSSVLGANPLTDDERTQVLNALKAASEK